jgi:hypothetical protein
MTDIHSLDAETRCYQGATFTLAKNRTERSGLQMPM